MEYSFITWVIYVLFFIHFVWRWVGTLTPSRTTAIFSLVNQKLETAESLQHSHCKLLPPAPPCTRHCTSEFWGALGMGQTRPSMWTHGRMLWIFKQNKYLQWGELLHMLWRHVLLEEVGAKVSGFEKEQTVALILHTCSNYQLPKIRKKKG